MKEEREILSGIDAPLKKRQGGGHNGPPPPGKLGVKACQTAVRTLVQCGAYFHAIRQFGVRFSNMDMFFSEAFRYDYLQHSVEDQPE